MSFSWLKNKKILFSFLLIFIVSSLGVFVLRIQNADAVVKEAVGKAINWVADFTLEGIMWLIAKIGAIIHTLVSIFFWIAALFLQMVFGIEEFTKAGVVQVGWILTRDLVNLLFILVLMVIAFATILRIESYGLKTALPKLLIAVLLINFSLVIAGIIIDFSQVLTRFFISGSYGALSEHIASILKIQKVYELNPEANVGEKIAQGLGGIIMLIVSIFLGIFLILAAAVIIGLGAFLLIVRLIALWILLILAPLAWFFWILPATQKLWTDWWRSFLKWTFFAPVYAFFIYLALQTAEGGGFSNIISQEMENIVNAEGWSATIANSLASTPRLLLQFIAILGLLVGGLIAGQKLSLYGADGTMKVAKWIGKGAAGWASRQATHIPLPWAQRMGGWISRRGEGRTQRGDEGRITQLLRGGGELLQKTRGRGVFSPGAWRRAWPAYRKEIEAIAYARPTGALRDQLNFIFSLGRARTSFEDQAIETEVNRRKQEIAATNRSSPYLLSELGKAVAAGHQVDTSALIRLIFEQNDQNDLITNTPFGDHVDHIYSDENCTNVVYDTLNRVGFTDEQQAKIAMDLGNLAYMSGNYMNFGMGKYDSTQRRFKRASPQEQRDAAARKASGVKAQTKADMLHWNTLVEAVPVSVDPDGIGNLHGGGEEYLRYMTDSEIGQSNRLRRDFIEKAGSDRIAQQMRNFSDRVENGYDITYLDPDGETVTRHISADTKQAGLIRKFAAQLEALRTGRKPTWYGPQEERQYGELRWVT
ncbi:MAG: hypothetical protein A3I88_01870 [Candidatus Portnoybacteria bacterium RIFCSPLOWO2_12_FULL_39_9]|uniref:Uncharacterized protein n=1 Tax=Candidatus Portnoybacteria bacterium RIFCSPHIGHO2_12_FULL_38_9 TaxID=1801997 RepID=A0A1G2FHD7_9BACT|nr:MAG: hypothetical protein A3H00_03115 [Candidatus Portnoybacteria bacterium RBG_13_40_8]OGZ36562.1 MAG: hypothetical protein A2646_00050 [Candidatus Portnoybacteria bacterium RIFCSPHIGHO2_02_FULL_39_12]OGZ37456.1 MAG: hypothetical protein A3J64_00475 [Candidatus Portnoybacteria bacterium RIFCSPHIGHO2_12_FULL_38_9]OGZ39102.1 MAG: hypothetical protein A3F21_00050 [Candidatus Portnoybacteria bacterium RIFCSPLOWO2_01_FULL_38_39]OGZ40192.1 MAG: hypothetical protein A3I88_01870 [Candidatus Portnoy